MWQNKIYAVCNILKNIFERRRTCSKLDKAEDNKLCLFLNRGSVQ